MCSPNGRSPRAGLVRTGAAFAHAGSPRVFGGGWGPKKKRARWDGRAAWARRKKLFGYVLKEGTLRLVAKRQVLGSSPRVSTRISSHHSKAAVSFPACENRICVTRAGFFATRPPMDSIRHAASVGTCAFAYVAAFGHAPSCLSSRLATELKTCSCPTHRTCC